VTGNTVSNNSGIYGAGNGITIEVSCNATINSNVASGNYLAGIQVRNSHDVNVGAVGAGNTVSGSVKFGIRVVADKTGTQTRCGAITASNNHVIGNDISMPVGTSWTGVQRVSPAVANGDTFSENHYHMPLATDYTTGLRWKWWDGGPCARSSSPAPVRGRERTGRTCRPAAAAEPDRSRPTPRAAVSRLRWR
jgi:parallel beta-helix repeat protein